MPGCLGEVETRAFDRLLTEDLAEGEQGILSTCIHDFVFRNCWYYMKIWAFRCCWLPTASRRMRPKMLSYPGSNQHTASWLCFPQLPQDEMVPPSRMCPVDYSTFESIFISTGYGVWSIVSGSLLSVCFVVLIPYDLAILWDWGSPFWRTMAHVKYICHTCW